MATPEKQTPRPSQVEAIELALAQVGPEGSNGCLIGDEPGFGKTLAGTEIAVRGRERFDWERVLFVALPDTHKQWADRILAQSDGEIHARIMNGTKEGKANLQAFLKREPGFYIAGSHYLAAQDWETVERDGEKKRERKGIFGRATRGHEIDALLFDECQVVANRKSRQRQTIFSIKANLRVCFSGTWFLNKVENMWSIAKFCWPGYVPGTDDLYVDSSFDRWVDRFLTVEPVRDKRGRVVRDDRGRPRTMPSAERIPGEFVSTLPAYLRRENEDRVPEPTVVYVDPTPEQARQYAELEDNLMAWVRDWEGEEAPLVVDLPIVLRTRLRQATIAELSIRKYDPVVTDEGEILEIPEEVTIHPDAPSAKLGALRGIIDGPWAGQPVGIYTSSKIGAKFVAARMQKAGYSARAWTGDLTRKEREEMKQDFIDGKFQYIVVTIQSFGVGLDQFQTVCNKVIWVDEVEGNPSLNDQAIARFFRPGRIDPENFAHCKLVQPNSVDEMSFQKLIQQGWAMRNAMNPMEAAA